eukprot:Plantae.Rhodophyta-Purpureofilum_apyrenoidigerum.ctg2214.p1 GENE.Plantae.Rhodophyta-Purpureofilum_apyrenoidigerum.ctg2214~~Plantae.Rhodophyta-Purpureofilum_apyrenoidigerum.ctg2214.p1  ORF type:complete len:454 (+),score=95.28 Plantae.Rhodophyta-Purpureofilum_apyrenoidigerum.ctg2214:74-1435(+)
MSMNDTCKEVFESVKARDPNQPEFLQAAEEVFESLSAVIDKHPEYTPVLKAIAEPERLLQFRVPWYNDKGELCVNRGFRIEMNSAIGPYKGGLRFHKSVNLSILKFLAFEQVFKNSLTTLPMGGGKGGSDFDPKGKSDAEIRRFCQSFMLELFRHIGPNTDVPAGDIGVGGREVGYMYGMYKKVKNEFTGVLTGKGMEFGGSLLRPEATGYGCVYFVREMLKTRGESMQGKTVLVSGSGNVAQYAIEKCIELGATCVTCSDSGGYIYDADGITTQKLEFIMDLKNNKRGRISEYADKYPEAKYTAVDSSLDYNPLWTVKGDIALPCATQNEINGKDADNLLDGGVYAVGEGANMPTTPDGVKKFIEKKVLYGPGKAANAGGVAVSGLEMAQNSIRYNWSRKEVDEKLDNIMTTIHQNCADTAKEYGMAGNYVAGANIAGFLKVARAMTAQGIV